MALKVGALWLREATDKEGKPFRYFSGVIQTLNGDAPVVVFKNNRKEKALFASVIGRQTGGRRMPAR